MDVWLGVDVGTSALKVVAVDAAGTVGAAVERALTVDVAAPGRAEADPADWHRALDDAVEEVLASGATVRGVGCTGQMHGTVLLDAAGEPVAPAVLWPDRRAVDVLDAWRDLPPAALSALANPLVPGMTGPVLCWLRHERPELMRSVARVALPKDVLRARWTGDASTDPSDASATLLWDLAAGDWQPDAVELAGVGPAMLPDVVAPDRVQPAVTGLLAGVPVAVGGGDTACSLLAARRALGGGWPQDTVVVNLGTGAQVIAPDVDRDRPGPGWTHRYADVEGGAYAMAAVQNGGLAVSWAASVLGVDVAELVRLAGTAPPGAGGVTFAPWLAGERGGVAEPGDSASWVGMGTGSTAADLARSAVEALAFVLRRAGALLDVPAAPAVLVGGGARAPFVRQLLADVLGMPLTYVPLPSAAAVGAASLAAAATGGPDRLVADTELVEPRTDAALEDAYARWCRVVTGSPAPSPG